MPMAVGLICWPATSCQKAICLLSPLFILIDNDEKCLLFNAVSAFILLDFHFAPRLRFTIEVSRATCRYDDIHAREF